MFLQNGSPSFLNNISSRSLIKASKVEGVSICGKYILIECLTFVVSNHCVHVGDALFEEAWMINFLGGF